MHRVGDVQRQLAAAQQITHIGSWEWDLVSGTVVWSDELYRIYGLEPGSREITTDYFLSRVHPDERARLQREIAAVIERGGRFHWPERIVRPDGSVRDLDTVGEAETDGSGRVIALVGTCRDVTEATFERRLQLAEHQVLEMVARSATLADSLAILVRAIEEHSAPVIGSVLLLEPDGVHLRHGAAPNLPEAFQRAIDGSAIGPRAGSCGSAAFLKRPVIVRDIETDALWDDYRDTARAHGLRACWSVPILATDDRVLGTFAFYYRAPRTPAEYDLSIIERAARLAGIAIERKQLEQQLRDLSAHIESALEDERTGIAREIHDELGQSLTALKMDIAWIARRATAPEEMPRQALLEKLGAMSELTDAVIGQIRRISAELRPGVLDDLGLVAAIEWLGQQFEERTGITCTVRATGGDGAPDRDTLTAAFRVCQEALTNVTRHARAEHVEVRLDVGADALSLEVSDDGAGITPEAARSPQSLGLLGMRERARRLGGSATIRAGAPKGTLVALAVPLRKGGAAR